MSGLIHVLRQCHTRVSHVFYGGAHYVTLTRLYMSALSGCSHESLAQHIALIASRGTAGCRNIVGVIVYLLAPHPRDSSCHGPQLNHYSHVRIAHALYSHIDRDGKQGVYED